MNQVSTSEIDFYNSLSLHQSYDLSTSLNKINKYPLSLEYGSHVITHRINVKNFLDAYINNIKGYLIALKADDKIEQLDKYLEKANEYRDYWQSELEKYKKVVRDYEAYRKTRDYEKDLKLNPTDPRFKTTKEYTYRNDIYLADNMAIAKTNTKTLNDLIGQLNELLDDAHLASDKYRHCINMVGWANDFGLTDFLLEKSKDNFTRAAKLLGSITGTNAESIRKVMEALYKPNGSNKKNSPLYKQLGIDYINEMREKFGWLGKKQGNLK